MDAPEKENLASAPNREAGFSILELSVALPILAVLSLSLAASAVASMRTGTATSEQDVAREAARGQMEEILGTQFSQVRPIWDQATFGAGTLQSSTTPEPGSVVVDSTNPDLLVVRVIVDWGSPFGDDQVELTTLIADVNPE